MRRCGHQWPADEDANEWHECRLEIEGDHMHIHTCQCGASEGPQRLLEGP